MTPWLESLGVLIILLATGLALPRSARHRGWVPFWLVALLLSLASVQLRNLPALGRLEYLLYGPLTLLLLGLPSLRTPRVFLQVLAGTLAVFVCWLDCLAPFLGPALYHPPAEHWNAEGICLQPDGVSCGPAAAATALRRMGVAADFADLVGAAHTSPAIGTPPDLLTTGISSSYGLEARLIYPERLEDVPGSSSLLVMNLDRWTDHYVVLFQVRAEGVEVGDPLRGRVVLERKEFERRWRHEAIVLNLLSPVLTGMPR